MLIIFLLPLWMHSKAMGRTYVSAADSDPNVVSAKKKLDGVIRHNIRCSVVALVSAFLGLTGQAVLMWIANDTTGIYEQASLRMWGFFCTSFDNFIGIAAIHLMTSAWLPHRCRPGKVGKHTTSVDHQGQTNDMKPYVPNDKREKEAEPEPISNN